VVPGPQNTRRHKLDVYFASNGIEIERLLELDAMIGTLDFVAQSDWVCFLPSCMLGNDFAGRVHTINPLSDPPLGSEFVTIEPARLPLSVQANIFLDIFKQETAAIIDKWRHAISQKAEAA
jgi:DNA-binding transcriptional LysR family regulator